MNDGIKITIQEWAGDNKLHVTDEQIEELVEGIEIAQDMSIPWGYGVGQIATKEKSEIQRLKRQIDLLERYIVSKGYNIILHDEKITRTYMVNWGDISYSQHETFK